jgi:5'-nucleotidase
MDRLNFHRWKISYIPHGLIYTFLGLISLSLLILTIIYAKFWRNCSIPTLVYAAEKGMIGFPLHLPNDGRYIQWTFLHFNDVYEIVPLDNGRKGGLARVASIRKLLKEENPHTYTILGGDFLSPSALSTSKINGTMLNGRQMIATLNSLGLDLTIFGNHEFDLSENELLSRMNESKFSWISTNIFRKNSSQLFGSSISHQFMQINQVRILLLGLTIDKNSGYVQIINQSSLIPYVQQFLHQFPPKTYDLLVAITHLDILFDIELADKLPQIDLILGGHEHENSYYIRGRKYTSIYKADANAFTVYILRCAYNLDTKQFRIYPTLSPITSQIQEDEQTAQVANYWFNLGLEGFRTLNFEAREIVSCLPTDMILDGRRKSMRISPTLLTNFICESMLKVTESSQTTIAIFNNGAIRIDDILRDKITQYDILRTLPFQNEILVLLVPGQLLARILRTSIKPNRIYLSYIGIQTLDGGQTWLVNGNDISISNRNYTIATIEYTRKTTELNNVNVILLENSHITQTKGFLDYMKMKYPPC